MFSQEDINNVLREEFKEKEIREILSKEKAEKEEMQGYITDDILYDSLNQEAFEEYCVPVRRWGR